MSEHTAESLEKLIDLAAALNRLNDAAEVVLHITGKTAVRLQETSDAACLSIEQF